MSPRDRVFLCESRSMAQVHLTFLGYCIWRHRMPILLPLVTGHPVEVMPDFSIVWSPFSPYFLQLIRSLWRRHFKMMQISHSSLKILRFRKYWWLLLDLIFTRKIAKWFSSSSMPSTLTSYPQSCHVRGLRHFCLLGHLFLTKVFRITFYDYVSINLNII
jgi:hypothetical protein